MFGFYRDEFILDSHSLEFVLNVLPMVIMLFIAFPSLYLLYFMEDFSSAHFANKGVTHPSQLSGFCSNYSCESYVVYDVKFGSFSLFRFSLPVINLLSCSNGDYPSHPAPYLSTVSGQVYVDHDIVVSSSGRYSYIERTSPFDTKVPSPPSSSVSGSPSPVQPSTSASFSAGSNNSSSGSSTLVGSTSSVSTISNPSPSSASSPVVRSMPLTEAHDIIWQIKSHNGDYIHSLKSKLYHRGHLRVDLPVFLTKEFPTLPDTTREFSG
jgi:hypothetical protein